MASTSSRSRPSSPFRFRKPASLNGKLPGLSQIPTPPHSSSSSQTTGPSSMSRASSVTGRPLTPSRGRNALVATFPSLTPLRYRVSTTSPASTASPCTPTSDRIDFLSRAKENVSVTVRFRPLNAREIQRGDEIAWYADGDVTVRSDYSTATAYAFDRVFGPATTTRGVFDIAAQHVVSGAMEGVNGTVFAYGVTSSGKTHTMHGDQKSPGIIPLAVKDVFSIIQETPGREFLLRVSYLEIYNEVINDLLDPAGQNLRVREDGQGTYVEGIKEEVVLSPAHALSLIAAGEEHRHVGSNNFNLLSSRSHTIFTLTIESSARGEGFSEEDVTLSQLNLIDLAGSESSKTETTGLRRKEGAFINKSLLTLGTVIAKLSEGKASHIPYRDSKLTRLLQSSLSGHGRISLICTITPASSNSEETHNTLKFAHRAKRVEIHASPNRILDEKSLIKKYQREISCLKQELDQLKRGILEKPFAVTTSQEDLLTLRQQLEAGQVKMQSRLEEEEQAKAALMGRIQRLTKLILVSTKNSIPPSHLMPEKRHHRRRHSFGEEELAYLPDTRRDLVHLDDENDSSNGNVSCDLPADMKGDANFEEEKFKDEKKTKRRGMLAWFKLKRSENLHLSTTSSLDSDSSPLISPASISAPLDQVLDLRGPRRSSISRRVEEMLPGPTQAGELFSATVRGRRPPPNGTTMADQMDLLREQVKMLGGEVALCTSSLKRLSEQAVQNPDDSHIQIQMRKLRDEIQEKKRQMKLLEQRVGSANVPPPSSSFEMSQTISNLMIQLNEKAFDLEIKSADNRILQEQLQTKAAEMNGMLEAMKILRQQLAAALENKKKSQKAEADALVESNEEIGGWLNTGGLSGELRIVEAGPEDERQTSNRVLDIFNDNDFGVLRAQLRRQASEIEILRQDKVIAEEDKERLIQEKSKLEEDKKVLQTEGQQLADEAAFARELASRAVVELKNLADEVTKLSFQNAKLSNDLSEAQEMSFAVKVPDNKQCQTDHDMCRPNSIVHEHCNRADEERIFNGSRDDFDIWGFNPVPPLNSPADELKIRKDEEEYLKHALLEKERKESELLKQLAEGKEREVGLENDLAGMWVLVAQLRKELESKIGKHGTLRNKGGSELFINECNAGKVKSEIVQSDGFKELESRLQHERQRNRELGTIVQHLKSEQLDDLDLDSLYELQNVHVEALTKLCQAKNQHQKREEKERLEKDRAEKDKDEYHPGAGPDRGPEQLLHDEERSVCKVCFESPTAAVLLPCRHFCLCKICAVACTECPLCRSAITDRIVTYAC